MHSELPSTQPPDPVPTPLARWWWYKTLFGKISLVFCLMLLLLAGFQVLFTFHFWSRSLDRAEQIVQWGSAASLAGDITAATADSVDLGKIERIAERFRRANGKADVYLVDENGRILLHGIDNAAPQVEAIDLTPIRRFLEPGASAHAPILGDDPGDGRSKSIFSVAPLMLSGRPVYVYVTFATAMWRSVSQVDYENAILTTVAIWSVFSGFSIAIAAIFLFRLLTRRFSRITDTVRYFQGGDFRRRIGLHANDELGLLGATIDDMAGRIEDSMNALKERDSLRRELIATVSHDLRGPLTNIRGNFELLERPVDPPSADQLKEFRRTIGRNLEYLSELLNQLFELAKLEAQELKPELEDFPIDQLVDDLAASYRSRVQSKNIDLKLLIDERPVFVRGDIRILDRVFMNLLENAIKFTPSGGAIVIGVHATPSTVRLTVSDTGAGIAAADITRIFEKFYQGAKAPRAGGSTGLGLAIVDRLLKVHGSTVGVESEVGKGTTFFFELGRVVMASSERT